MKVVSKAGRGTTAACVGTVETVGENEGKHTKAYESESKPADGHVAIT